ncbi:MAG: DUF1697 domain-containing protein [Verrucomicrobia bacterium]|nr:DUF1697 domain-containing protein [Verrucomicrobiota bacterium]
MAWAVFLRAVNVGRANRCRPALLAQELADFGLLNIGAVGTWVVREDVSEPVLRRAIAERLPFKCEIMVCSSREILQLAERNPFTAQSASANMTRFVNVLHQPPRISFSLPLLMPTKPKWLLKVIAIEGRFVLGVYRREMKAIACLGKLEKQLGAPSTTRNWNTIEKVVNVLRDISG